MLSHGWTLIPAALGTISNTVHGWMVCACPAWHAAWAVKMQMYACVHPMGVCVGCIPQDAEMVWRVHALEQPQLRIEVTVHKAGANTCTQAGNCR